MTRVSEEEEEVGIAVGAMQEGLLGSRDLLRGRPIAPGAVPGRPWKVGSQCLLRGFR